MLPAHELDALLERLSSDVDGWIRAFFERQKPSNQHFAALLAYPLGWVGTDLQPLDPPAPAGKRLRPALCLLVCQAVGGASSPALPAAGAVELVHNFSLVHDDIQDQSPLRRGRPSVWALWQTAQAINVGDSLFALAQLAVLESAASDPALAVAAARRLNNTCLRLVEGQFLDLELQANGPTTLAGYQTMIAGKTGALLECAAWLGAAFGGAHGEALERWAAFGRTIGQAFQLQDDVLGVWGDPAETGKSAETDLLSRKQALPALLGLRAEGSAANRFRRLFDSPERLSHDQAAEMVRLLEASGIREQAERQVVQGYAQAEQALQVALDGQDGGPLRALVRRFRERTA